HCKGQEIYWDFYQDAPEYERDRALGGKLARLTGYTLTQTGASAGGYKDWCISHLKIPSYTIEIVPDSAKYPVSYAYLTDEFRRNKDVPLLLIENEQ
ncbi:MAG: hypothetical protein FWE62_01655, partial [Firmicutes bacterium]|nr:hypothetical protein [Bacillota bacterium]